jgi:6-phospho-beta-glucosidase
MKIAIIGGGGARTPAVVYAFVGRYHEVPIGELALYDIDAERLGLMADIAEKILQKAGRPFSLRVTRDLEEAIASASFVITTFRVGGEAARAKDERIALRCGCIGQETAGAGGFAFALRSLPVALEFAEVIGRLAPDAWLINFTNPAGLVIQALQGHALVKAVGVCDSPHGLARDIARAAQVPVEELEWHYSGLNHLGWVTSVRRDGVEILPDLLADTSALTRLLEDGLMPAELVRHLGIVPNEYLYYYYFQHQALERQQRAETTRGEFLQQLDEALKARMQVIAREDVEGRIEAFAWYLRRREETYLATERTGLRRIPERPPLETILTSGEGYIGVALEVIAGLRGGEPRHAVLNVTNKGAIAGMEDDDVVETSCEITAKGIRPLPGPGLPTECWALMQTVKAYERLTVEAALQGSKREAIRALTHHPLVGSYERAKLLVDSYLVAHREYLPRFWRS